MSSESDRREERVRQAFSAAEFFLSAEQASQLAGYWRLLLEWNERAGLISKGDEARILERHLLESALLSRHPLFVGAARVIDVGTGGGFPGLPLKIVRPDLRMTLLDSKTRKTFFLREVVSKLNLADVWVECDRAENLRQCAEHQQAYDVGVCRAVLELPRLWPLVEDFLAPGGALLTLKGSALPREIDALRTRWPHLRPEVSDFPQPAASVSAKLKIVVLRPANEVC